MSGDFPKRPVEFYGCNPVASHDWDSVLRNQLCPFLGLKCIKQRKSEPQQTIGACTVGYQGNALVICPRRFLEGNSIFINSIGLLASEGDRYLIVPEVSMPGGSIDFFLVAMRDDDIQDYLGLEIQSLDTTGSGGIWHAREDLRARQLRDSYPYGINWKMSAKTILVQMHHKAESFRILGKKLVLVLQEEFYHYISKEFDTGLIRPTAVEDTVHFHVYKSVEAQEKLHLVMSARKSTDISGVERMLRLGAGSEVLSEEVIGRIKAKLARAVVLEA